MIENQNTKIANRYFQKAFEFQMKGKIREAIINYNASIEIHPTAEAYINLSWALSKEGRYRDAIQKCYKAIEIDRNLGNPYNEIGSYLIKLNKLDEAVIWLEEALNAENYDDKHYPYFNLGKIYERKGLWYEAIKMYDKALDYKPDYLLARRKLILLSARLN
ncbi:MAG: tetratricopeptide repeat protein [Melioribacteraceae bacterium]|nr:tetratricopeptide repeat protein [Melioribacteraceae bacterium]